MDNVSEEVIKLLQQFLNETGIVNLVVDGKVGPKTLAAMVDNTPAKQRWGKDRIVIGCLQYYIIQKLDGINPGPVDGLWGPQTEYAYEHLEHYIKTGQIERPWRVEEGIGASIDPTDKWPKQTEKALREFYGDVGQNQAKCNCPYPLKIAWAPNKTIRRFSCHEKVKDSMEEVLNNVLDIYGLEQIQRLGLDLFGGCLNVRKIRGGTSWSTHSWGISVDWDPANNRLRWKSDKAKLAKPVYKEWWDAWEKEGWTSLGKARNYDWMHVQAAKIKKR